MRCKLCNGEDPLQHSHIIPEFCYKPLYDAKHRLSEYDLTAAPLSSYRQKGFREYLFCSKCEKRFNEYENYFAARWFGSNGLPKSIKTDTEFVTVSDIDYDKFKFFHLSILYRASVATLPFFESVNLGKNETVIRDFLIDGDAPSEDCFPFIATLLYFPSSGDVPRDIIVEPVGVRLNGKYTYTFIYAGCSWTYFGSRNCSNDTPIKPALSKSGKLSLIPQSIIENRLTRELAFNHLKRLEGSDCAG